MKRPTPRRLLRYVRQRLGLERYLQQPGDGRHRPRIPAGVLLWALLIAQLLRECSFLAVERLARSSVRRALGVSCPFGDDTLGYFTERLDPAPTRLALLSVARLAKRNKAFDHCRFIGLAIDGTTAGRGGEQRCKLCRPYRNQAQQIVGYLHHLVMLSVVGAGLSLPLDVEPYGPGDSEYAAGQRMLKRVVSGLGGRFAQYLVVDSEYATAPFLHTAGDLGLQVVARLKANLPELLAQVQQRFGSQPPHLSFTDGPDRIEVWEAEDFDPWETLRWETVRVLRYRPHKPDGTVVQADWLTDFSRRQAGAQAVYRMAKTRWEIENQGFNDAKNRHGMEHLCHHQANSLLLEWLLIALALTIERLYRLRYLHRGSHPIRSAVELVFLLRLALSSAPYDDTS